MKAGRDDGYDRSYQEIVWYKLKIIIVINLRSDNESKVFPEILDYMSEVNNEISKAYGEDKITKKAKSLITDFFETEVIYINSQSCIFIDKKDAVEFLTKEKERLEKAFKEVL